MPGGDDLPLRGGTKPSCPATASVDALSTYQTMAMLSQLALPAPKLAQCLLFHKQVVPKSGIAKPVVMVRPPTASGSDSTSHTYDLTDLLVSIFSLVHEVHEQDKHAQVRYWDATRELCDFLPTLECSTARVRMLGIAHPSTDISAALVVT